MPAQPPPLAARSPGAEVRTATGAGAVAPWTRRFVWAFLAAFVIAGVFGFEAWPLTGWRLFADARPARQVSLQAVTVDAAGRERPVPWDDLPVRFRGNVQVLKGFEDLRPGQQAAVCTAWADAVRARGGEVRAVRIYRVETDVSRRAGDRAAPGTRSLRFTCRDGTVEASGGPGG
jgi:hypothetical protein